MKANVKTRQHGAVCWRCRHDLTVKVRGSLSDGKVYCSNPKCRQHLTAVRMSGKVND